jgi:hypothetical protein
MRTTLDIDEDVLCAVKDRARDERRSAGQVLSELAREALTARGPVTDESFFGFRPLPRRGGPPVTNELINEIREAEGI